MQFCFGWLCIELELPDGDQTTLQAGSGSVFRCKHNFSLRSSKGVKPHNAVVRCDHY
jgi:hypothetical protein